MPDIRKRKFPSRVRSGVPPELVSKRVSAIDVTAGIRALALSSEADNDGEKTPTATPCSGSPGSMITPPGVSTFTMFSDRNRQSSEATIKPEKVERPRLIRKSRTAPPRTLQLYSGAKPQFKPQLSRRAVSAISSKALARSGSRDRRRPSKVVPLTPTEVLQLGRSASRVLVSRRKSKRSSGGEKMVLKSKPLVWRLSSPQRQFELPPEELHSFSQKARVKETLKSKKMETLKVPGSLNTVSPALPSSPAASIIPTPLEMYNRDFVDSITTPPMSIVPSRTSSRSTSPLRIAMSPRSLTPLGESAPPSRGSPLSKTPRMSASPLRSGASSRRTKHFSLPLSPDVQKLKCRRPMVAESPIRSASHVLPEKMRIYIPGPIQPEERICETPRKGSIANMERFDDGVHKAKRFSDIVTLDAIVMYFEGLGIAEEASETCLDRFWLRDRKLQYPSSLNPRSPRKAPPVPDVPPPPVPTPPSGGSFTTFDAIFRLQKALRDDDKSSLPPSPGTPGRRKPLLRQLLKSSRKSG